MAFLQHAGDRILEDLAAALVDDAEDVLNRPTQRIRLGQSGERFGHGIDEGDASSDIGGDDAVADAREGDAQVLAFVGHLLRGPLADASEQDREQRHADEERTAHDPAADSAAPRPRVRRLGLSSALLELRALLLLHLADQAADAVHRLLPLVGADGGHGPAQSTALAKLDGAGELGQLRLDGLTQGADPLGLPGIVGDQLRQPLDRARHRGDRGAIGLEIAGVSGQDVAALSGLGLGRPQQDVVQLMLNFERGRDQRGVLEQRAGFFDIANHDPADRQHPQKGRGAKEQRQQRGLTHRRGIWEECEHTGERSGGRRVGMLTTDYSASKPSSLALIASRPARSGRSSRLPAVT